MHIALILGYGVHLEGDFPYLDLIIPHLTGYDLIIPCGGFTDREIPDISEALSIQKYLESKGIEKDFLLEDASLTTPENIINAKKLIYSLENVDSITIFCDSIRAPKVAAQALQTFHKYSLEKSLQTLYEIYIYTKENQLPLTQNIQIIHKNLTVKGVALDRTKEEVAEQILASLIEQPMISNSIPREAFHNWRRKLWKLDE